jgi:hypothetical protein
MTNIEKYQETSASLTYQEVKSFGKIFYESGLFAEVKSEAQAIVKIMAGREMGIQPFASMQGLDIIQGKVVEKPILIASKIKSSNKYDYRIIATNDNECTIEFYENKERVGSHTFTLEDAKRMGLAGKDNYKKYPREMLYNRCMSSGARMYCPDVFKFPVYDAQEIEQEPEQTKANGTSPADDIKSKIKATVIKEQEPAETAEYEVVEETANISLSQAKELFKTVPASEFNQAVNLIKTLSKSEQKLLVNDIYNRAAELNLEQGTDKVFRAIEKQEVPADDDSPFIFEGAK